MVCGSRSRPNALLRLSRSYSRFSPLINSPRWQRLSQGRFLNFLCELAQDVGFRPRFARALVSNRLVLPEAVGKRVRGVGRRAVFSGREGRGR